MTAEVAILNKFGVALAADSAVTVDHFHHNQVQTKVYNSANKLFTLSKHSPIGVMFYNAVTLGGLPWETIIKTYRQQLGKTRFDTIEEQCCDFFSWINNNDIFGDEHVSDIVHTNLIRLFANLRRVRSRKEFISRITSEIASLKKMDDVYGFDDVFRKAVVNTYRTEIENAAKQFLRASYISGQKRNLNEFVSLALTKKRLLPSHSGIVIAGFGSKESLPRLREYVVDVIVCGKVRYWLNNEYFVDENTPSQVVPLADAGVIKTLTEGISPGFEDETYNSILKLLVSIPQRIIEPITELNDHQKQAYISEARKSLPQQFREFYNNLISYRFENYTFPIKQAISSLPISELGIVAEMFLGASLIHKRVSAEVETVGGPIDVAVISKGDGFIWIKRKHYFRDELNPSFKLKYMDS